MNPKQWTVTILLIAPVALFLWVRDLLTTNTEEG